MALWICRAVALLSLMLRRPLVVQHKSLEILGFKCCGAVVILCLKGPLNAELLHM